MKIGVIGLGTLGETIYHVLKFYHKDVVGYDKYKPSDPFNEVINTDVLFIALPTPLKNGRLDCSIILSTLKKLKRNNFQGIIIIKSTLSIAFIKEIEELELKVIYFPEFLHAYKRLQDFVSPTVIVISGNKQYVDVVIKEVFSG